MILNLDGIFIAKVLDNKDPKARERLFVRVLGVHSIDDDFSDLKYGLWIEHCAPSLYMSGDIPPNNSEVYVQFLRNTDGVLDPMKAIWIGVVKKSTN